MSVKSSATVANALALGLVAGAIGLLAIKHQEGAARNSDVRLLNVSYDPTRELYAQLNPIFVAHYKKETGESVGIEQSHGGSSKQARLVAAGVESADVVTLALPSDIDSLRARKLVADNWQSLFPHNSQPYYSTIVFVVRKGNPKNIHDWFDLKGRGIEVVTPSFATSGNGKLSMLAAWGSVINRGGTEAQAMPARAARPSMRELIVTAERVVRERQPQEERSGSLLIYDLEGELFFGTAPELVRYLADILEETERSGIRHVVLRFRRARNPDAAAIEHLERFLRDANAQGVTVLLAGVRPDFVRILRNVRINQWFPTEHIFPEEDRFFSATLRAVRYANQLASQSRQRAGAGEADTTSAPDKADETDEADEADEATYYLV